MYGKNLAILTRILNQLIEVLLYYKIFFCEKQSFKKLQKFQITFASIHSLQVSTILSSATLKFLGKETNDGPVFQVGYRGNFLIVARFVAQSPVIRITFNK